MNTHTGLFAVVAASSLWHGSSIEAQEHLRHHFQRTQLTDTYFSEGANAGDLNRDGMPDVVHGPFWFEGPGFQKRHEIYAPVPQPRDKYADNFFSWIYDFNGDGWNDIVVVGFPGTPAYVYENPKRQGADKHWTKHQVFDSVCNESPQLMSLVGDQRPELVCTFDGSFGYATVNWRDPFAKWTFHKISEMPAPKPFGHGLGVGDVNSDGRLDVLMKDGWFEQPAALDGNPLWTFHAAAFCPRGGADILVYDVDSDGDNDVITSLAAHEFGLAWHEQVRDGDQITFKQHLIMGSKPEENRYGLVFSELHSVALADMDGDGLRDIVTGKTYWSHHRQAPMWDAGAVVYWFKLVRSKDGVDWVPQLADGEAGIGRQVIVTDLNQDKLPDIVVGGMKGCHVLMHECTAVSKAEWERAQPRPIQKLAAGLEPKDAARHMTVPEGFTVQLAAGEPQVQQPIAMAIDHRGRVWVAEAYTYPIRAPEGQGKDKIIILEDSDGDGTLDSRKVFIEGLNLVSGLEVGFGGVWVGAAPYLLFIPDKDNDDRPDVGEPRILLDGFGYQDTHETLNAFIWGPDGWLYGCHGVFTHSNVGKPGTPNVGVPPSGGTEEPAEAGTPTRTPMNAAVWRYHPTRHEFEVFAWGTSNPWGVDFNDHGQAFITACVIPHLYHVIQGARYERQGGRHFERYFFDDIKTIADHAHYVGNIRDHAWWGHEPQAAGDTLAAGGGHAHCGAMIYLADNWPEQYRNQIFFNNIHGNRVNNDLLTREGSGFVAKHGRDLLIANDQWFRGINLKYGPDGSVYLIDWYDRNACHRANPEFWDRTNGRVYKISYGSPEPAKVDLSKLSDAELVKLQGIRNEWYVRTARRILQERGGNRAMHAALGQIVDSQSPVPVRLRALWTLHASGGFNEGHALKMLDSPEEYIRAWTIQLQLEDRAASPAFLKKLVELASSDPSPVVRLYVASALQRLPAEQRWPIAEALASHDEDANDHNLPLMYWYGIEPLVPANPARAMQLAQRTAMPLLNRFIIRRAAIENQTLNSVVELLNGTSAPDGQLAILDEMLRAFEGRVDIPMPPAWSKAYAKLGESDRETIRDRADQLAVILGDRRIFPRMRQALVDPNLDVAKRTQALEILVRGRDQEASKSFQAVLSVPGLRGVAIRALAAHADPKTPVAVLAQYAKLTDDEKRDAIGTLTARPEYALALLSAVRDGKLPRTDIHAYHVRQLLRFENDELTRQIKEVWGEIRETAEDKQALIAKHKATLLPDPSKGADTSNGRRLFAKTCSNCHILFGEGTKVGPELTGSNRANLDYILENIIDPSAVLGKDYRMTILAMKDGRVVSGLVHAENDSAVTLRTINETVVLAQKDIEDRKLSTQSVMPDGLFDNLKPDEVRDLIAYLASPTQVALSGPRAPIDPKTRKVPGAIEGEAMKIIGKTAGDARSQPMREFTAARWSGDDQLWWTGAKPGARLDLELPVRTAGTYMLELVLTKARDYGIVQLLLDDKPLGEPIDLYNSPEVITTGVLTFDAQSLAAGNHKLTLQIAGAHPKAIQSYMAALDYVRLIPMAASSR